MTTEQAIALVQRLIAPDPWEPSEMTGDPFCHFCGADGLEGHDDDCAWVAARRALGIEDEP